MSTFVSDGRFTDIELHDNSSLLFVGNTPIIAEQPDSQYKLDLSSTVSTSMVMAKVASVSKPTRVPLKKSALKPSLKPQTIKKQLRSQYKRNIKPKLFTSSKVASKPTFATKFVAHKHSVYPAGTFYYGDLDGNGIVNAIDAINVLRIIRGVKNLDSYKSVNGFDRRILAYAATSPLNIPTAAPTEADVLSILSISAGLTGLQIYVPPSTPTPTPTPTPVTPTPVTPTPITPTPTATPTATPVVTEPPGYEAYVKLEVSNGSATFSVKNTKPIASYKFTFNETFTYNLVNNIVNGAVLPLANFSNTTNRNGPFIITGFTPANSAIQASSEYIPILVLSGVSESFYFSESAFFADDTTATMNVYTANVTVSGLLKKQKKKTLSRTSENDLYLGDLNRDGEINIADASWLASFSAELDTIDNTGIAYNSPEAATRAALYGNVNGSLDQNGNPIVNIADASFIASYVAGIPGFELPVVTPTPTPTPQTSSITIINDDWKLQALEGDTPMLNFVYQDNTVARIIPNTNNTDERITPEVAASEYPHNSSVDISETGKWTVMYPEPTSENTLDEYSVDHKVKQLKFLYDGYPQTLIMPMVDSTGKLSLGDGLEFGPLWKLIGETSNVVFYYRNNTEESSEFYPQVLIGVSTSSLSRFISVAKKFELLNDESDLDID